MTGRPAVLVLDVNETLSDLGGLAERFRQAGAPPELRDLWFAATLRDGAGLAAAGGYAEFADVARGVLGSLLGGLGRPEAEAEAAAAEIVGGIAELPLHQDVAPGLEALRGQGLRLVTLTNGTSQVTEQLLARAGVLELVEQRLSVADVGRWKPAPEPYHHAAACCEVEPEQAMLVAAHPWDVDGAKRAGLRAAWINRTGAPYPSHLFDPDLEAPDLVALAEVTAHG